MLITPPLGALILILGLVPAGSVDGNNSVPTPCSIVTQAYLDATTDEARAALEVYLNAIGCPVPTTTSTSSTSTSTSSTTSSTTTSSTTTSTTSTSTTSTSTTSTTIDPQALLCSTLATLLAETTDPAVQTALIQAMVAAGCPLG